MEILDKIGRLIKDPGVQIDMWGFIFALGVSAIVGVIVSALYQIFYENRATGAQVHRSFLLMAPSITALFIAIQYSLPLSLGLLGALSVIRFRTPIKEPEEVAFIMLLISGAVVCATFQFKLLIVLLFLATVLLFLQRVLHRLFQSKRKDGSVLITLKNTANSDERDQMLEVLKAKFKECQLERISSDEEHTLICYSFTGFNLGSVNGLESSLRKIAPVQKVNFFFNKQGALW
jgi:hypothetical protein